MTTLRQAAQQALEALIDAANVLSAPMFADAVDALRTALAQPEQEPVAYMSSDRAWMWSDYSKAIAAVAHIPRLSLIPLYTTPPQRPWVGLTEEEVQFFALKHRQLVNAYYDAAKDTNVITAAFEATVFYKEIATALKERNHD